MPFDNFDFELLARFDQFKKQGGISLPAMDRDMILRYGLETASENRMMGKGLSQRIEKLLAAGLVSKTAYLFSFTITEKGTEALKKHHKLP